MKKPDSLSGIRFSWRRVRDLNPRSAINAYTISSRVTQPALPAVSQLAAAGRAARDCISPPWSKSVHDPAFAARLSLVRHRRAQPSRSCVEVRAACMEIIAPVSAPSCVRHIAASHHHYNNIDAFCHHKARKNAKFQHILALFGCLSCFLSCTRFRSLFDNLHAVPSIVYQSVTIL